MMPNDLPPWAAVCQQTQRWIAAGVFEDIVRDPACCFCMLLRLDAKRGSGPTAVILRRRTLRSTPESRGRAGYDGRKRK